LKAGLTWAPLEKVEIAEVDVGARVMEGVDRFKSVFKHGLHF
jgi:hypothetical protein